MMVTPNEQVIADARQRGETLTSRELLLLIERRHRTEGPGIDRTTLDAYGERVGRDDIIPLEKHQFTDAVDDNSTDSETWEGSGRYYALDENRVSAFPARWHEVLDGEDDLRVYVDVIETTIAESETTTDSYRGGIGAGVPEQLLLNTAAAISTMDRNSVKEQLERRRDDGELIEDADQHPDARVYLPEDADALRSGWINN